MRPRDLARPTAVLAGLLLAAVSFAQQSVSNQKSLGPQPARNPNQVVGKQNFGPTDLTYVHMNGLAFYPYSSASGYGTGGPLRWATVANYGLEAPVQVPTGAIIDYLSLDACDTNAALDMPLSIYQCDTASGCTVIASVTTTGSGGCAVYSLSGIGYTVDNGLHALDLEAVDAAADGSLAVSNVTVGYRLQVSPAPATATFGDVDTGNLYFQFIEALAASGVTAGCDSVPNFCPDRPITRAEMAVFMAKALGLHFAN
jgi:hypothetical protein